MLHVLVALRAVSFKQQLIPLVPHSCVVATGLNRKMISNSFTIKQLSLPKVIKRLFSIGDFLKSNCGAQHQLWSCSSEFCELARATLTQSCGIAEGTTDMPS